MSGLPLLGLLAVGFPNRLLLMVLAALQKNYIKTLLLKMPHSWIIEREDLKLVLSWKLDPYRPSFIVLDGAVHTTRGGRQSSFSLSVNPMNYSNNWPGKRGPLGQDQHTCCGSNCTLSDWMWRLLHNMEPTPGIVNGAKKNYAQIRIDPKEESTTKWFC